MEGNESHKKDEYMYIWRPHHNWVSYIFIVFTLDRIDCPLCKNQNLTSIWYIYNYACVFALWFAIDALLASLGGCKQFHHEYYVVPRSLRGMVLKIVYERMVLLMPLSFRVQCVFRQLFRLISRNYVRHWHAMIYLKNVRFLTTSNHFSQYFSIR